MEEVCLNSEPVFDEGDEYDVEGDCTLKKSEANNPRPETRTGCPAMIVIRLVDSKRWRIVEVELEHNHQVSPQIKRFYKSHKKMILAAKKAQPSPEPVTEVHTIKLYRTAVYTKEIFKRFQSEVEGMYSCFNTRQVNVNGPIITYIVKERVEVEGNEKEVKYYEKGHNLKNIIRLRCKNWRNC
ncbi:protein far1-related sequence 6 [Quercus suber]|uniref:Protein far1-related sequence 6 n=1 Tax=Quercus suber TaxID=58331 RepID=A0AAW0LDK0_QUESU